MHIWSCANVRTQWIRTRPNLQNNTCGSSQQKNLIRILSLFFQFFSLKVRRCAHIVSHRSIPAEVGSVADAAEPLASTANESLGRRSFRCVSL